MIPLLRQLVWIAVSALISWWIFLAGAPEPAGAVAPDSAGPAPPLTVYAVAPPAEIPTEEPAAAPPPPPAAEESEPQIVEAPPAEEPPSDERLVLAEAGAPPLPELGDPEGEAEEGAAAAEPADEPSAGAEATEATETIEPTEPDESEQLEEPEPVAGADPLPEPPAEPTPAPDSAESLMQDPHLLEAARAELAGEARRGFATVLLAAPEEQLDVARAFREDLVLVPRRALDPAARAPRWFRVDTATGTVYTVDAPPPLERFHRYRDLFEYEYARLPGALRDLRRRVPSRGDVALFAAVIPASEWALIVGRRQAALALTARAPEDVRRFVLRYVRRGSAYDVVVEEIVFADGTRRRFQPRETGEDS